VFQLVLGRSGSGKSTYLFQLALKYPAEKVMFVVPEQFTLETERRLLDVYQTNALPKSTATSFSQMARDYLREYEPAGQYINGFGKHILMDRALREEKDALRLFNGKITRSLIENFLALSSEMKTSCLTPEEIMAFSSSQAETGLSDKMHDIALICAHYNALVSEHYIDDEDDLTKLANGIVAHKLFSDKIVFIDGFHNFSAQEERVIEAVMTQAEKVYVTVPCADLAGDEADAILFENVRNGASRLLGACDRLGVAREKAVLLKENRRAKKPALKEWETSVIGITAASDNCEGIELYRTSGVSEEASLLAALIKRDVFEKKCRYRDCAVICRSVADYETVLQNAFACAEIPIYTDSRADIRRKPLFMLLQSALETAAGKFPNESAFRCLKTGFFPVARNAVYRLEKYCLLWNYGGKALFCEYTGHPRGFGETWSARDKEVLADCNATREKAFAPLERLCRCLTGRFSGETLGKALYDFLTELKVPEQIKRQSNLLRERGEEVAAKEEIRLWEQAVSVLEQLTYAAGDLSLTAREALELFDVACTNADMGRIPPTADAVTVGSADRIRVADVKNVYLFGCNEGDFPRTVTTGGLLTDRDRRALKEKGLTIGGDALYWSVEELFIAYKAFSSPSEKLTVLYHTSDSLGNKTEPSVLVSGLKKKFPSLPEQTAKDVPLRYRASTRAAALALLAAEGNNKSLNTLREALKQDARCALTLQSIERAGKAPCIAIQNAALSSALFGENMRISATKLEAFNECRYRYFLQYGLSLTTMEKFGLKSNTVGTVAHDVLEHSLRELSEKGFETVTPEEIRACVRKWSQEYFNTCMKQGKESAPSVRYQLERIEKTVTEVAFRLTEEFKQSAFRPVAFELRIGENGDVKPYVLTSGSGSIQVEGKIDRVDYMEGEQPFVRVVDYKTGDKLFSLQNVIEGKDLQMLLYLFALRKNGGERFAEALPGGVLYCPVKYKLPKEGDTPAAQKKCRQMNGLFLNNLASLRGMERELSASFIPITQKDEVPMGKTLATEEEIDVLQKYVDLSLLTMHDELNKGGLTVNPSADEHKQCDYCRYKEACAAAPERFLSKENKEDSAEEPMAIIRRQVEERGKQYGVDTAAGSGD